MNNSCFTGGLGRAMVKGSFKCRGVQLFMTCLIIKRGGSIVLAVSVVGGCFGIYLHINCLKKQLILQEAQFLNFTFIDFKRIGFIQNLR